MFCKTNPIAQRLRSHITIVLHCFSSGQCKISAATLCWVKVVQSPISVLWLTLGAATLITWPSAPLLKLKRWESFRCRTHHGSTGTKKMKATKRTRQASLMLPSSNWMNWNRTMEKPLRQLHAGAVLRLTFNNYLAATKSKWMFGGLSVTWLIPSAKLSLRLRRASMTVI